MLLLRICFKVRVSLKGVVFIFLGEKGGYLNGVRCLCNFLFIFLFFHSAESVANVLVPSCWWASVFFFNQRLLMKYCDVYGI